ncbi:MAG: type II secretion system protein N [Pseudomonadota bacterium]
MKALVLGLVAFLAVLLVRLPAKWLLPLLPSNVKCSVAAGTVWRGSCDGLSLSDGKSAQFVIQQARWTVHPLALLRARLSADVTVQGEWGQATATTMLGSGSHLVVNAMSASGTLDRRLLPVLPAGWRGSFEARDVAFDLRSQRLLMLRGMATVHGLQDAQGKQYGDYQLQLAPQGDVPAVGDLRSLAGPVSVAATVRVAQDLNWVVDGTVNGNALSASGNF